jgi:two-component system, NarL family, response regulator LiaR
VDDHPLVRAGLSAVLRGYGDVELVGEASSGDEAIRLCNRLRPHVVLMDLVMPQTSGVEATAQILRDCPGTRIIALTGLDDWDTIEEAIRAGVRGLLFKSVSGSDLITAIRAAAAGRVTIAPEAVHTLVEGLFSPDKISYELTPREREILSLMVDGCTNGDIACKLTLSVSTVKTHVSHIMAKLGAKTRTEAATLAVREGLV